MVIVTHVIYYLGPLLYLAAAVEAVRCFRGSGRALLTRANQLALGGAVVLGITFAARWLRWGRLPLTTASDALVLFTIAATVIVVIVTRKEAARGLLCFYLPPIALVCLMNMAFAPLYMHKPPREELSGVLLGVHVGMVFVAYAMFFVASLTSMAYVFQAQHLKRRETTGLVHQMPALEELDATLFTLIRIGYPIFMLTLILGMVWAWLDRELLGASWWLSPKIALSCLMVVFYALMFHIRRFGLLRGPKLAYLVFCGFTVLLAASVILGLMNLTSYNFWGAAS